MSANNCRLNGIGAYTPSRIIDNEYLTTLVDTSDEWIVTRTGIRERRMAAPGETCSDIGFAAAAELFARTGVSPDQLSHVIVATCSGDYLFPSTASVIARKLGLKEQPAFDISAACAGFLYGLEVARGLVAHSPDACVLLLASELLTARVNWEDRSTCVLFGDAGGGTLVTGPDFPRGRDLNFDLIDVLCKADGTYTELLHSQSGSPARPYKVGDVVGEEYFIHMEGREVYKHAVRNMTAVSRELLARNGLAAGDVDLVIPHQANQRIIEAVADRLEVGEERLFTNVQWYGNTSASSIPLALFDAGKQGRLKAGMRILMTTFGAGLTWSAALFKVV